MKSTYLEEDVTLLLKDISGLVTPLSTREREERIQSGTHYSEMLPLEYKPSEAYMDMYFRSLKTYARETAAAVCRVSEMIYASAGDEITLVSLARAGIPVGILIKRYLNRKYRIPISHYSISIIRGRGIDKNAMNAILKNHSAGSIRFVDGWIGKGAIQRQLNQAIQEDFPGVSPEMAVISDPANTTALCGTHEDILIPSSCLNCTVSGLISRTFLRPDLIGPDDYHGAIFYGELIEEDLSYDFINAVEQHFQYDLEPIDTTPGNWTGLDEVKQIAGQFQIDDINLIKPGIGEATRVLLRRVPWRLLLCPGYENDPLLSHLVQLAQEKHVPIEIYDLKNYKACGIIKNLADA